MKHRCSSSMMNSSENKTRDDKLKEELKSLEKDGDKLLNDKPEDNNETVEELNDFNVLAKILRSTRNPPNTLTMKLKGLSNPTNIHRIVSTIK